MLVNSVSPGAILWDVNEPSEEKEKEILNSIPLKRIGNEHDIVSIIDFLVLENSYMTGRNINIDGGKVIRMNEQVVRVCQLGIENLFLKFLIMIMFHSKKQKKKIISLIEEINPPAEKLDAGLVYAALQLAIENNRLSQKTKNASSDNEQRIEEISEKLNIFLNQQ